MIRFRSPAALAGLCAALAVLAAFAGNPALAAPADSATADTSRLAFRPYAIKGLDGIERPAEMGRLVVPETHARPNGRKIAIIFIRLRSRAAEPGPPVVFLPGGPGNPGTLLARVPPYLELFERLRERSDVLILDQRGSGLSEPTLQCAVRGSLATDAFESEAKTATAIGGMVRPCARLVRGDGFTLEAYNTAESAEDLEDLRVALGAERLRLIGVSYGTELALEMIRRHGDRVDAAVFAGTRGPDMVWRLPLTSDFALKRLSKIVAADPRWAKELPDLEGAVRRLLERVSWKPATIRILDRKTGKPATMRIGSAGIQAMLASDLSDWTRAPLLPAMLASLARGDSTLFVRAVDHLVNATAAGISVMQVTVDCASGVSPERRSRVAREAAKSLFGNVKNMLVNPAFCDLVGNPDLGPAFRDPIYSPVRALFLTGENDGATPPSQAEEVRWGFPNGIHLVLENGWHETLSFQDVQQTVDDFFAGREVRGRRVVLPAIRFLSVEEAKAYTAARAN